jgi:hypothetical protein
VPKLGLLGSVRGVRSNAHPYRKQNRPFSDGRPAPYTVTRDARSGHRFPSVGLMPHENTSPEARACWLWATSWNDVHVAHRQP